MPSSNPAGPWLVTPDEIDDIHALAMWLDVNGARRQTGTTKTMIFDPHFIIHYLSQFLVLEPGDLINTGTPPGVGMGFSPPVWLQPGDVMKVSAYFPFDHCVPRSNWNARSLTSFTTR
jgi:2,4-didehydro-3-deoxy-L-rhamnonate hydrolase